MIFCRKLDVACRCESGPYIPRHDVDRVRALAAHRADMECHVQEDAGHAFDTHGSTMFYRPAAARRAWRITEEFLARPLLGRGRSPDGESHHRFEPRSGPAAE